MLKKLFTNLFIMKIRQTFEAKFLFFVFNDEIYTQNGRNDGYSQTYVWWYEGGGAREGVSEGGKAV